MSETRALVPVISNSLRLQIEEMSINQLKRNARSPRRHPVKQIAMLARNIDTFGFLVPCLIDENNRLLNGAARLLAAERLGMTQIPVIRVQHLSEAEKRALIVADNKLAGMGVWDPELLRTELQFFAELGIDFDFSVMGFETAEVDVILDGAADSIEDDALPPIGPTRRAVSRLGDLWVARDHRILCADARCIASYQTLLRDKRARLVVTDPPYNVPIVGHVGGNGAVQHREFAMASGELPPAQFATFLATVARNMATCSIDGSLHYSLSSYLRAVPPPTSTMSISASTAATALQCLGLRGHQ